jgi:hypothetical protein
MLELGPILMELSVGGGLTVAAASAGTTKTHLYNNGLTG